MAYKLEVPPLGTLAVNPNKKNNQILGSTNASRAWPEFHLTIFVSNV